MSEYAIIVTLANGQVRPIPVKAPSFDKVSQQALSFAQNAAVQRSSLMDESPPRWVDVVDAAGELVVRIVVDESLRPQADRGE